MNEIVEVPKRKQVGLEVFGAIFRLAQQVFRAADDHLAAMLDVAIDGIFQRQHFRPFFVNRQHVHAVGRVHASELENLVGDNLRAGIALQFDLNAGLLVGQVAHARNPGENFFVHQLGDAFLQSRTIYPVWHFADC